jgi:hypothetical protein
VVKKRKFHPDRSVLNIPLYDEEYKELKDLVDTEVKSPPINSKRRLSIQNITQILPYSSKIENEDIEDRLKLIQDAELRKKK